MADCLCRFCGISCKIMKRCSRCHAVMYCSRNCQIKDWNNHKANCIQATKNENQSPGNYINTDMVGCVSNKNKLVDYGSNENAPMKCTSKREMKHETLDENPMHGGHIHSEQLNNNKDQSQQYINKNNNPKYFENDISQEESELPADTVPYAPPACTIITLKCNKSSHKLSIPDILSGEEIMQTISQSLRIPLDKLKLICKGKKIDADIARRYITDKALFLAIGEQCEDGVGLSSADIDAIVRQLQVDKNTAIKALRKHGDVIDAIFAIANEK